MIPLYTELEFKQAKYNDKLQLECEICQKPFLKLKRVIQATIRGDKGHSGKYCSKECEKIDRRKGKEVKCENCNIIFYKRNCDINSTNNNFCSKSCAAIYNNKNRPMSEETKEKIRKKLQKNYEKQCPYCEKIFTTHKKNKIFCNFDCWKLYKSPKNENKIKYNKPIRKKIIREKPLVENRGGYREKGGRCNQYEYINIHNERMMLNKEEIEVAKYLDLLKLNWNRNIVGFGYLDLDGKNKKFYPDFYVKNYDYYIEYKGWVIDKMIHKMKNAVDKNNMKLLIIYTKNKKFRHLGYNMDNLIENPNSLIEIISN